MYLVQTNKDRIIDLETGLVYDLMNRTTPHLICISHISADDESGIYASGTTGEPTPPDVIQAQTEDFWKYLQRMTKHIVPGIFPGDPPYTLE